MTDPMPAPQEELSGTILLVDDEPSLAEMYAAHLDDRHEVHVATGGRACLEMIDDNTDVVLLDRRMPDLSGDEVLATIRREDYDCMVAMITAVRPREDIIEMEFDDYLVKPVSAGDLNAVVDELLLRAEYSSSVREMLSMAAKIGSLRAEHPVDSIDSNPKYRRLIDEYRNAISASDARFEEVIDRIDTRHLYVDLLSE